MQLNAQFGRLLIAWAAATGLLAVLASMNSTQGLAVALSLTILLSVGTLVLTGAPLWA